MRNIKIILCLAVFLTNLACGKIDSSTDNSGWFSSTQSEKPKIAEISSAEVKKMLESANLQTQTTKSYAQDYVVIPYPNGDLPIETGACTDVVIRSFRAAGVDLQKEVHEDMQANFALYPQKWGLPKPDTNIDHRRVPNLQTFFTRKGKSLPVTTKAEDYKPGDVVAWDLDGKGMTHIGVVSNVQNESTKTFSIIHNIGGGARLENRLFEWKIIGHYRYF
jgi:uncharacterized protein YijF (DUF1287 family)